jgi:hypothetical protein
MQIWDLWFPDAAAQGMSFARGRLDDTNVLLVHAPPPVLRVEVRDDGGALLAAGDGLARTIQTQLPMARLVRSASAVTRLDVWPEEIDLGRPVILPGGEVGILRYWWNAGDFSEWRWQLEFYNHR